MRLAEFIRLHQKAVIAEWEDYARTCPPAPGMSKVELRNNITGLLEFIASDLEEPRTRAERQERAKALLPKTDSQDESAAAEHAEQRFRKGFDTLEMISEFRVLRASIIKLWSCPRTDEGIADLNRFNEAIDQAMSISLNKYMENERRARTLFLGTLIHDLRNPVDAIAQAVQLLLMHEPGKEDAKLIAMIQRSAKRMGQLVSELIDAVRIRLGKGIPVAPVVSNIGEIAKQVIDEIRIAHPATHIHVKTAGDMSGEWDNVRMGQLVSNLVGNAVQHGGQDAEVDVAIRGEENSVALTVHNTGTTIPADLLPVIFDPLTRGAGSAEEQTYSTSLGLGLFITHEIVAAHRGSISVTSTDEAGTTFTVRIPKRFIGNAMAEEASEESPRQAEI